MRSLVFLALALVSLSLLPIVAADPPTPSVPIDDFATARIAPFGASGLHLNANDNGTYEFTVRVYANPQNLWSAVSAPATLHLFAAGADGSYGEVASVSFVTDANAPIVVGVPASAAPLGGPVFITLTFTTASGTHTSSYDPARNALIDAGQFWAADYLDGQGVPLDA